MVHCSNCRTIENNRLVKRQYCRDHRVMSQGKRLTKDLLPWKDVIRAYVKSGTPAAIRVLREKYGMTVQEGLEKVNELRGDAYLG